MSPHQEFEVFLPVPSNSFADCNNRQLLYNLRAHHPNTVLRLEIQLPTANECLDYSDIFRLPLH